MRRRNRFWRLMFDEDGDQEEMREKFLIYPCAGNLGDYFRNPEILGATVGGCNYCRPASPQYSREVRQWPTADYSWPLVSAADTNLQSPGPHAHLYIPVCGDI
jgi:hypothetical protein